MPALTLFTFGYWGWGNGTTQLLEAVDAVERARGYDAPFFVDIRISRSVRAKGFNGSAFENQCGYARYRWMQSLGNTTPRGPGVIIKNPNTVGELLDLAAHLAEQKRRLIFFCSCEFPKECHRLAVASLAMAEAERRGWAVDVTEWPGGPPRSVSVTVNPIIFKGLKGRKTIPLPHGFPLAELAGLPWGTTAVVRCNGQEETVKVGPARYRAGKWCLPVRQ